MPCLWRVISRSAISKQACMALAHSMTLYGKSAYPRKHREFLRAIVAVRTGRSFYQINLRALDAAYRIVFPNSTPINVNKKSKG